MEVPSGGNRIDLVLHCSYPYPYYFAGHLLLTVDYIILITTSTFQPCLAPLRTIYSKGKPGHKQTLKITDIYSSIFQDSTLVSVNATL